MLLEQQLTESILQLCFEVSNELGPGFLESVYKQALFLAFKEKQIDVETEVPMSVLFRGATVGTFYVDFLVDKKVIVEIKAVKVTLPEHEAQLLNYLRASKIRIGLIVNFGKSKVEWKRMVL
jgi:GxxExxY protein